MSNLIELQNQIDALQKQANEIRAREFDATVQDILAKMSAFGISLKDLQPTKMGKAARLGNANKAGKPGRPPKSANIGKLASDKVTVKAASKKVGAPVPAKFQGPNGETWSGRGLMPRWLSALVAQGKTKEEFAIKTV